MSRRSSRSVGYSKEEDKFLCKIYLEISQEPITGTYQTTSQFWDRVAETFENRKNATWSKRTKKSIQCRFQTIEKATKKLQTCIRQCQTLNNPSSDDIIYQAKEMLMEDPKFKCGWKFDHVWNIIKNFEKFKDGGAVKNPCGYEYIPLGLEHRTHDCAAEASPRLSSLSINLGNEDNIIGGSPSERPIGVKKSKSKRRRDDQTSAVIIKNLIKGNRELVEQLKKTSEESQHHLEIKTKKYALKELKEENKVLLQNLNSIENPNIRAYVEGEQIRILQKRIDQQTHSTPTSFR